jgi:hypothetical protein
MAVNQSTNVEARDYATESMSVLAAHAAAEQAREMLHAGVTGDENPHDARERSRKCCWG